MNDGETRIKLEKPEIAPDRRLFLFAEGRKAAVFERRAGKKDGRRDETFPGVAVQVHDRALNLIGDSHEWRVIYPGQSGPSFSPTQHHRTPPRPARSSVPVRGHCAKLCSNGDGVTLICLSPLLHSRRVIRRASLSLQVQRQPLRYCHGSTSWRLDRPGDQTIDRSATRYTRPVQR